MKYALGISFQVLRMQTKLGDSIRYVFLLLVSFEPVLVDIEDGEKPDYTSLNSLNLQVGSTAISFDQLLLTILRGISSY